MTTHKINSNVYLFESRDVVSHESRSASL